MSQKALERGFLELDARGPARRRLRGRFLKLSLVLAVVAVVVGVGYRLQQQPELSYEVKGGRVDPNGVVEANGKSDSTLRFSDGTAVVFLAGARGRVKEVGEHDARIALSGKVSVSVVPRHGSRWLFEAGPFAITVTGTAFTAEWLDAEERLEVALRDGAVSVAGPHSDQPIALRAGQRLVVSTREKRVLIQDIDAPTDAIAASGEPAVSGSGSDDSPPPPAATLPVEAPAAGSVVPPATTSASGPAPPSWAAELAAGRFASILRQAEERGLDAVLDQVSSGELAALADAARYSRREDVARRALTAQRRRFPGSARANDAAFLLGRLEETAQRLELALGWYERCLAESANGTYTSEALGRKMTLVRRLHGEARARPVAEDYLRRFANGTYAAAARALTRDP